MVVEDFPESEFVVVGSPVQLRDSAGGYGRFAALMGEASGVVAGVDSSGWVGAEGEIFRARQVGVAPSMEVAQTAFGTVARVLGGFADEVETGQSRMSSVREQARVVWARLVAARAGLAGVEGGPVAAVSGRSLADAAEAEGFAQRQAELWRAQRAVGEAEAEWEALRGQAATIHEQMEAAADRVASAVRAAAAMADLVQPDPGSGSGGAVRAEGVGWFDPGKVSPPPSTGGPEVVAAWWAALTPRAKAKVVADHPGWVASLDGVPFAVRDAANRARVDGLEEQAREELAVKRAELAAAREWLSAAEEEGLDSARDAAEQAIEDLARAVRQVEGQLAALATLRAVLAKPDRRLLVLELPEDGLPRAAVAVGDLDAADKVAVLVPGYTSTVAGMGVNVQDMANMRKAATTVLVDKGESGSVATVAWLDYDIPQSPAEVVGNARARDGGAELAGFLGGVNATRDIDPGLTVWGHSYGSVTAGYGLVQPGAGVDQVVFFGSPGVGTEHVSDIRVPGRSVWYAEAVRDPVGDLAWFGPDPSTMAGVQHLDTGPATILDGLRLVGVEGHSDYLDENTTSQYNLAAIVAGHPEAAIQGSNLDWGDTHPDRPWRPTP
ncbi:MAG: alpha/beta hydrolase [Dermatophilaceae bacterium]